MQKDKAIKYVRENRDNPDKFEKVNKLVKKHNITYADIYNRQPVGQ